MEFVKILPNSPPLLMETWHRKGFATSFHSSQLQSTECCWTGVAGSRRVTGSPQQCWSLCCLPPNLSQPSARTELTCKWSSFQHQTQPLQRQMMWRLTPLLTAPQLTVCKSSSTGDPWPGPERGVRVGTAMLLLTVLRVRREPWPPGGIMEESSSFQPQHS